MVVAQERFGKMHSKCCLLSACHMFSTFHLYGVCTRFLSIFYVFCWGVCVCCAFYLSGKFCMCGLGGCRVPKLTFLVLFCYCDFTSLLCLVLAGSGRAGGAPPHLTLPFFCFLVFSYKKPVPHVRKILLREQHKDSFSSWLLSCV